MLNDTLANVMSNMHNAQKKGKSQCIVTPSSKKAVKVLEIMQDHRFIGKPTVTQNRRGGIMTIPLIGAINKCAVIKPRFPVKATEFEKFEKRYLPAKDFGILIVSTSKGMMTHIEAKQKNLGGVLLAYVY